MRAIRLEVASNLTSGSFISAFRRFFTRRGQLGSIRCDSGIKFVGSQKVLESSYELLGENKVEATVNSRPLTIFTSDSRDPAPLTPNKLLNMGDLPAGCDIAIGGYSKQRWKKVQHIAEQFWARWKREYKSGLQQRQKWFKERRNVRLGDIVLMINECVARCQWPLAQVVQIKAGKDGLGLRDSETRASCLGSRFRENQANKVIRSSASSSSSLLPPTPPPTPPPPPPSPLPHSSPLLLAFPPSLPPFSLPSPPFSQP
ncbi:uncharacterized protein LOC135217623 [Macrobrachium nipponense]|uniref:uncharacterized protein LOC135217623 n=1 Tax=Macrobrachium nipponense TaxID=159736 RepID=UPI0030C7E70E